MNMKKRVRKIGRDAKTGRFIPLAQAKEQPATTVTETIREPKQQ